MRAKEWNFPRPPDNEMAMAEAYYQGDFRPALSRADEGDTDAQRDVWQAYVFACRHRVFDAMG